MTRSMDRRKQTILYAAARRLVITLVYPCYRMRIPLFLISINFECMFIIYVRILLKSYQTCTSLESVDKRNNSEKQL